MYNDPNDLITIDELCSILSIGRNAAYTLLKEQKIKAFRIGRVWKISRMAVEDFILTQSKLKWTYINEQNPWDALNISGTYFCVSLYKSA